MKEKLTTSELVFILIISLILIGLLSWGTMALWNGLLVAIFPNVPTINYWMALLLYVFLSFIFHK